MIHSNHDARQAVRGGAIAGVIAGGLLTVMMTVMSLVKGNDVWYGIKGAASPFLGNRALVPGFDFVAVYFGLVSHLAISAIWGVLFGLAFYGSRKGVTVVGGILWSFVVWVGMYFVVLPLAGLEHMAHEAPFGRVIVYHLIFSVPMAVAFLPFQPKAAIVRPRLHPTRTAMHSAA